MSALTAGGLSTFLGDAARSALGSAVTQGIGVATGLQDKFSWAGVAAAGIGGAVGNGVARELGGLGSVAGISFAKGSFANDFASTAASTLANAATRSAIEGSNFGNNIIAALPDAIGGVLGRALGGKVVALQNQAKARSLFDTAMADPAVQNALKTPEAQAALVEVGYRPGETISPEQLANLLSKGSGGLSPDAMIAKIKGNIVSFVDHAANASGQTDVTGRALAANAALIASYSAIGLTMPGFQWTMIGASMAKQVRQQIINIDSAAATGKLSGLAVGGPLLGPLTSTASRLVGDTLIATLIAGQINVVSDIGSLALSYRLLSDENRGSQILNANVVRNDPTMTGRAFKLQIESDEVMRAGDTVRGALLGTQSAILLGIREQTALQSMWDNPLLNTAARAMSSLGLIDTRIYTPIGVITAPRSNMDVTKLGDRIDIATNAFNYMNRNLYNFSDPRVPDRWKIIIQGFVSNSDKNNLSKRMMPSI